MAIFENALLSGLGKSLGGIPGTLMGSGLSYLLQGSQMDKQFENQKKLMDYQSKLQKDMMQYNWQNQYGAQVQGMKGAGLNPSIMQGGSFGLNSAPSVSGGSASALPVQVPSIAENALLASQKANVDADTKLKESEANKNNKEADNTQWHNDIIQQAFDSIVKSYATNNYKNDSEGRLNEKLIELNDKYKDEVQKQMDLLDEKIKAQKNINDNFKELFRAEINNIISSTDMNRASAAATRRLAKSYETYYYNLTLYTIAKRQQVYNLTPYEENLRSAQAAVQEATEDFIESQIEFMPVNEIGGVLTKTATAAGVAAGGVGTFKAAQKYSGKALGGAAGSSVKVSGFGN